MPLGLALTDTHYLVHCISCPHASALIQYGNELYKESIIISQDQPSQPHDSSMSSQTTNVATWDEVQAVECLPRKHEALSSVSSTK